ncbi:hypothetical protein [Streptomyces albidochromogenes]|uniref:Uncharacterized protein n=1 Tax=Streptomyces albidochromogenes TaxID=329524 RepID=A0ABW6FPR2_9ACTN
MTETAKLHDDEVDIDASLVARLISAQFPQWADPPIRAAASSSTDDVSFRLGTDLAARLPRTPWAAGQLPVRVVGRPGGEPARCVPGPPPIRRMVVSGVDQHT